MHSQYKPIILNFDTFLFVNPSCISNLAHIDINRIKISSSDRQINVFNVTLGQSFGFYGPIMDFYDHLWTWSDIRMTFLFELVTQK